MDDITTAALIDFRPIEALRPYARNARKHSPEQVIEIALSMRQWGWTMPVLIDETGEIVAGHGRVMAADLIYSGFTVRDQTHAPGAIMMANGAAIPPGMVPVMVARGWTEAQKRAYVIADNRLTDASTWDDDILRVELQDLLGAGFDLALTGMAPDDLTRLSVGVSALEAMPELADGERSPYRDITFILYGEQAATVDAAIKAATVPKADGDRNRSPSGNALVAICDEYLAARR